MATAQRASAEKEIADRQKKAAADKAKQDSIYQAQHAAADRAEAERQAKLMADKNRQDSINAATRAAAAKADEERKAKAMAEIEAKKAALAAAQKKDDKPTVSAKSSAPVPKIVDSDYKEGVTEETIKETNRTIYRTVVKKDGTAYNFQKVVYNWGGVFFFKNDNAMTETTFMAELKNFKEQFK
ncbi:MAG: hypothetical protein IPP51_11605 [Bacteroidetes bacterium]|nr:hypothetical protein [Bacteroidota bacterium]